MWQKVFSSSISENAGLEAHHGKSNKGSKATGGSSIYTIPVVVTAVF